MLAVIIAATIIITITDVTEEWVNVHRTPLSEAQQTDQKEPKVEIETPVTNLGNTYETVLQMLAHEIWTKPKEDTGRQWNFTGKSMDPGINLTEFSF